ncbi:S-adenosyl-L-methionine-dependent methyltransferase [Schizophyllum commune H4-8]|uniref:SAM-dependent MTase RsmB/NOP-type domain-containing protein n=1 Tax=Schizophyllum commune (strain H4-8 / FGSC 9210) TaxID=578458 RepID=D8PK31_SCHCM|nr:S-adenosyl-L-methionine-dependent methyltransferase [Schizophyllum commune H4-8]KAI5897760.1 S-adenosyl-L-methionine-dependent methyltransferase [Schizophyllum commune H4-8]
MNFYFSAAKTLDRLDSKQGSIKGVLATLPEKDRKRTAALVIETLKYKAALADVIKACGLLAAEKKITSLNLALVLVHDLLLAKGIQAGDGPVKQAVLRHKTRLQGQWTKMKIKRGAKNNEDLAQVGDQRAALIPRYARVNTNLWSVDEAVKSLQASGSKLADPFASTSNFTQDAHVPELLLFSPKKAFHNDAAYKSGKLILQDKASCFPPLVLNPPASNKATVIDATAAPGNKTTYLSALMGNNGKLFAFERDKRRFQTLKTMVTKAACKNVLPVNADFLTIDPNDETYSGVTHILLDPSCSGSGIVNRLDYLLETEEENDSQDERLAKLASFQLMMIKHAMKFPSVCRIVYSTCSIHAAENEHVVREALASDECRTGNFTLASRDSVLPTWPRRGMREEMGECRADAEGLIRCLPGEDATNGFFVSCFVRRADGEMEAVKESEGKKVGAQPPSKKRKADDADPSSLEAGTVPQADGTTTPAKRRKKKKKKAKVE